MDLHTRRANAGLGLVALTCLLATGVVAAVAADLQWVAYACGITAFAVVPLVYTGDRLALPPWELLVLAAIPALVYLGFDDAPDLLSSATLYLGVAAMALLFAADLHAFGEADLSPGFAVGFVAAGTMAMAGLWTITRFASDVLLYTTLLPDEDTLMWELVTATGVGVLAGLVFQYYLAAVVDDLDNLAVAHEEGEAA
jgi:hypothetical protein